MFCLGLHEQLKTEIEEIAFSSDVDLREYAAKVDAEVSGLEEELIQRYIAVSPEVAGLHNQICACDVILQRMEAILANFHNDLGTISSEIQELQMKSIAMNKRLQNRQAVHGQLNQFLSDMALPEQLIKHILFTSVTEQEFLENLHELDHKINFSLEQSITDYRSFEDVNLLLGKLKIKAVTKIREYLLQKIYALRKPLTNYQISQNQMLKYRFYNAFLLTHDRETAMEIKNEYVTTMSKVHYSYFKAYCAKLMKLQFDTTNEKGVLLGKGFDEQNTPTIGSQAFPSSGSLANTNGTGLTSIRLGLFGLGDRASRVLGNVQLEEPVILPHVAVKADVKYPVEVLFRSIHFALLDVACREYFFLADFFHSADAVVSIQNPTESEHSVISLFDQVLGRTLTLLSKQMEHHWIPCMSHDALGMLLCLQIIHALMRVAHGRSVPVLDRFWTSLTQILWVRVTDCLDAHISSLRNDFDVKIFAACAQAFAENPTGAVCGTSLSARAYSLLRPHPVARRYAELAASLYSIGHGYPGTPLLHDADLSMSEQHCVGQEVETAGEPCRPSDPIRKDKKGAADDPHDAGAIISKGSQDDVPPIDARIRSRLAQLQTNLDQILARLSDFLPKERFKWVFLVNNYELIVNVLTERRVCKSPEIIQCREAAEKYTVAYIDEALSPYFGSLITFVLDFDGNHFGSSDALDMDPVDLTATGHNEEARITRIIKGFNIDWKNSVEKIKGEIMVEFTSLTLGTEVFQALLTRLVQYYHRFQRIMSQPPFKHMPVRNQLINIHYIMNEIKKCKTTF